MEFLHLISQNILSPAILFFALGIAAGFVKSDLEVPDSISRYLSLYLMMAIGFKGGVAIANTHDLNGEVIAAIGAGLAAALLVGVSLRGSSTGVLLSYFIPLPLLIATIGFKWTRSNSSIDPTCKMPALWTTMSGVPWCAVT